MKAGKALADFRHGSITSSRPRHRHARSNPGTGRPGVESGNAGREVRYQGQSGCTGHVPDLMAAHARQGHSVLTLRGATLSSI